MKPVATATTTSTASFGGAAADIADTKSVVEDLSLKSRPLGTTFFAATIAAAEADHFAAAFIAGLPAEITLNAPIYISEYEENEEICEFRTA